MNIFVNRNKTKSDKYLTSDWNTQTRIFQFVGHVYTHEDARCGRKKHTVYREYILVTRVARVQVGDEVWCRVADNAVIYELEIEITVVK